MQRFGEKLRTLRQQRGMTVRTLAQSLGYRNHSYLSLIETGKITPQVDLILKVAQFFGQALLVRIPLNSLSTFSKDMVQSFVSGLSDSGTN